MTLLRFENMHLAYGHTPLLNDASLTLEEGERVAILGRNGAGKSSLMKLVSGEIQPDGGSLWRKPTIKIGVLPQVLPAADDRDVFEVVALGLAKAARLLAEFDKITQLPPDEIDLDRMDELQHQLDACNGWALTEKVEQLMKRLHLNGASKMSELSGGWRKRVALAQALVSEPDLLLLDEPTNHLDIETIQWLEEQIKSFPGAVLLITHDRSFMQNIATRMLELDLGEIISWEGRYAEFLEFKDHQLEVEARHQAAFDKKLAQEEVWIRQGIKARRTRNEGRVRALQDLRKQRSERLQRQGKADIQLETADQSGKLVAELTNASFNYEGKPIINNLTTRIQRGDKIGLLGRNGAGKTTLLKMLLGDLQPQSGEVKIGTKIEVAYFDQLRGQLDPEKTVLDNLAEGRTSITINGRDKHVIGYLQDFLFTPERARQPVRALSGGEQNRLLLAKLFAKPANLLVMDEPTNDLDLETLELLEELLLNFDGTLLLVSHDRAFLDSVVTGILAFEGDGKVKEYVGGYEDWLRQGGKFPQLVAPSSLKTAGKTASTTPPAQQAKPTETPKKPAKKLSYKLQRELEILPSEIEQLEKDIANQESKMGEADFYQQAADLIATDLKKLEDLQRQLEVKIERWAALEAETEA
ncbi:MAG TPA: ATP-binding cassette domain-containing protein [Marinospirillum sp.]|uniref:ATP-binding cassette domain-containing protein n=1 Tax=Marinospirillum sp. TaxID=2183934 RepID=UPI002B486E24|nr:ATP-binding cassette domain-containing protein [Marinospirillum sp.]HKM15585.1 ATP-binding cassette domain-containing protein [Marinospirillum sp.]